MRIQIGSCLSTMVAISISKLNHRLYASCCVGGYQVWGRGQGRGEDRRKKDEGVEAVVHISEMGIH